MANEEKQLLLKVLCAMFPYGVKVQYNNEIYDIDYISAQYEEVKFDFAYNYHVGISEIKPYLRPMSSMTEEEKRELSKKYVWDINCGQIEIRYHSDGYWDDNIECPTSEYLNLFDWLNAHHFDYRGLIEKGLALEAPEEMYQ